MEKTLIIGGGVSGRGCAQLLEALGESYEIVDDAKSRPPEENSNYFSGFKCAVVSPGIGQGSLWLKSAKQAGLKCASEAKFVLPKLRDWGIKLIGITGTNGKTTTTLFCTYALKGKNLKATACGNVGYALGAFAHDLIKEHAKGPVKEVDLHGKFSDEVAVIELSSYQLEDLEGSFFDSGAILNLSCDHLDRHETMENYAKAKGRLTFCMKKGACAYVQKEYAKQFPIAISSNTEILEPKAVHVDQLPKYEAENLAFAYAILRPYGFTFDEIIDLYTTFPKPKHRRSFVGEIEGVRYINDSKATNLAAVKAAFDAETGPVWLMTSGQMKRESFKDLDIELSRLKGVIAFGQSQSDAISAFSSYCPVLQASSLQEAVHMAKRSARAGETVLFSPGGASFDLFENYIDRGEQFEYTVSRSLLAEGASHE
jgi:UDP-N-acetylmuramoylalanine--D-glutamate ligase